MGQYLVTGVAGFIGMHVAHSLLGQGHRVIGLDSINDYYDRSLKQARLATLADQSGYRFIEAEVTAFCQGLKTPTDELGEIDGIVHLAAQPGVRYSLENPHAYVDANIHAQVAILELARQLPQRPHVVYASSSSVYGRNTKMPWSETDRTDHPASLYAATKKSAELTAETYAHLYDLDLTGLRFFTVYGPWGRPDMAPYIFTKAMFEERTIRLFNYGKQRRDFTYIDDIVAGVVAAIDRPREIDGERAAHRVYNLGNNQAETLEDFVAAIEAATGHTAKLERVAAQPGDVVETYADITRSKAELGFEPKTRMADGLQQFVDWYRDYHNVT
ncbi:MAG: GDP-mannose 4,6-dehydratase [Alphaproteobacteria bacterium]|nr:GDP-mannose 4,6-dehydratase [Alphaproteobacteria bacterium SS10]